jgi:hypothetical protein
VHFSNYVQTLPSAILQEKRRKAKKSGSRSTSSTSLLEDSDALHYRSIEDITRARWFVDGIGKQRVGPQPPPLRALLLMPRVLIAVINYGFLSFCDMSATSTYAAHVVHVFGAWWSRLHAIYDRPCFGNLWHSQCVHPGDAPRKSSSDTLAQGKCLLSAFRHFLYHSPAFHWKISCSACRRRRLASMDCYYGPSCDVFHELACYRELILLADARQHSIFLSGAFRF